MNTQYIYPVHVEIAVQCYVNIYAQAIPTEKNCATKKSPFFRVTKYVSVSPFPYCGNLIFKNVFKNVV